MRREERGERREEREEHAHTHARVPMHAYPYSASSPSPSLCYARFHRRFHTNALLSLPFSQLSAMSAGVQGSGWGWLGYDPAKDKLFLSTTSNQDPLVTQGAVVPLLGIDVWEHVSTTIRAYPAETTTQAFPIPSPSPLTPHPRCYRA